MNTTHSTITKEQLADFSPIEGKWDSSIPNSDDRDLGQIESDIASSITAATGYAVRVELFREDGRAILDDVPGSGSFVVTRK